jgi:hypothetical protein
MPEMTGSIALQLIDGASKAVDAAGSGDFRGVKLIMALRELGIDLVVRDLPQTAVVGADRVEV